MTNSSKKNRKLKKIRWELVKQDLHQIEWKDPIVVLLCVILLFLTAGSTLNACTGSAKNAVRVELDAAYGGSETGYQGIVNEAEVSENIVNDLEALLKKDRRFKVFRTHEAGTAATIAQRVAKIEKDNPMFVLSIHADGHPDADLTGMHVYAKTPSQKNYEASLKLADAVASSFVSDTWPVSTGYLYYQLDQASNTYQMKFVSEDDTTDYKLDSFELMKQCSLPVVVTNQFYVTNQSDVSTWANTDGYQKAAEQLYHALCSYNGFE